MSGRLVVRRLAEADIGEAKRWYEARRVGLGDEFIACVEAAFLNAE